MSKIVPLISSGTAGPLGVKHLPRLWLKGLLGATGQLADGYTDIGPGYDQMVIEGLGLDLATVKAYLRASKPSYCQFEAWIKEQPGAKVDAANIEKVNESVAGYIHDDETRKEILDAAKLPDDGKNTHAVCLNQLDDWTAVHKQIVSAA